MDQQEMADRIAIQMVLTAYCHAIDFRDWDALDQVFLPDAVIDYTAFADFIGNLAEAKRFLADSLTAMQSYQHIISTSLIDLHGDSAEGRTICTNPMVLPDGQMMVVGLWYRDRLQRTPQGWRIAHRREENAWRHNVPEGLLPPAVLPNFGPGCATLTPAKT